MSCAGWHLSTRSEIPSLHRALPQRQQRLEGKGCGSGLAAQDVRGPWLEGAKQTRARPSTAGPEDLEPSTAQRRVQAEVCPSWPIVAFGPILMLFLVFCPLLEEATLGHRSTPLGWGGFCFLVVWGPGSTATGGQEAGRLGWKAEWLANWCVSREQADPPWQAGCRSRCLLSGPLRPADFLVARLVTGVIYGCAHPCWPPGIHAFPSRLGSE